MADPVDAPADTRSPVRPTGGEEEDSKGPKPGSALCLSGGGYRAMVFHLGAIWRLYECGLLGRLSRVSSVSGGSITAGLLALRWQAITPVAPERGRFEREMVAPIRALASKTLDVWSVVKGVFLPGRISDYFAATLDKDLYGGATLQDLPDDQNGPRFVINATNLKSGVLWRFSKPYMGDYRTGRVFNPVFSLARAVAASSGFPPVLAPLAFSLDPATIKVEEGNDLHFPPFTTEIRLADGGVYDNLGLETAWKNYRTVFVSDAGGKMAAERNPWTDWASLSYRILMMTYQGVVTLRKRQVIASFTAPPEEVVHRDGAYWGVASHVADFKLVDPMQVSPDGAADMAAIPTRLKAMEPTLQERLINWGYAITDTAIRKWVDPQIAKGAIPYPNSPI